MRRIIVGALCYLFTWVSGIVFLVLEKENKFVRFHAMQSIVLFLPLTAIMWLIGLLPFIGWMLTTLIAILTLILWLILMLKAYQGEKFKLPVVGDIAERQI